jgi:predicted metal-dependent phosphoesterase TrpH
MGEKLTKCGFPTIYADAKAMAGDGSITRAHFAKVLHQQGHVSTMQQAFDKYIGKKGSKGQRAYVKPNWCSIEEAIQAIHHAGGSAVMAHPIRYDLSAKWLRRLIVQFSEAAGDGLEVVLPQMSPEQRRKMLAYCQEYNLYASMGSDFHYPNKWSDLGRNLTMPVGAKPVWAQWQ